MENGMRRSAKSEERGWDMYEDKVNRGRERSNEKVETDRRMKMKSELGE